MNEHWIQLVIGVWILASPWVLGFSSISVMMWSNLIVGVVLVLLNLWIIFDGHHEEQGR